jgi:hypothetical protein
MTLTQPDPADLFPDFYTNPHIKSIASRSRWTVSDNTKMPIDIRELMRTGLVYGASRIDETCLTTLNELTQFLPTAANCAFHLRAQADEMLVLDIEKTCPPEIAAKLLGIPETQYSELSMSGRGYHLVLPLPDNFWDYPIAAGKTVLQEEHGWYEILLEHWVTFTREQIPADRFADPSTGVIPESPSWNDLYASLAKDAVVVATQEISVEDDKPDIPREESILDLVTRQPHKRNLDAYQGDISRWEFAVLGVLYNRLNTVLIAFRHNTGHAYDHSDQAWLLYMAAQEVIPHRDKHNTHRSGIPLMMSAAISLIARRSADDEDE